MVSSRRSVVSLAFKGLADDIGGGTMWAKGIFNLSDREFRFVPHMLVYHVLLQESHVYVHASDLLILHLTCGQPFLQILQ